MSGESVAAHAADFASHSKARRCDEPNRVHFRLGPQVRLGLLPTPSRDDAVASGCFPVSRLGTTEERLGEAVKRGANFVATALQRFTVRSVKFVRWLRSFLYREAPWEHGIARLAHAYATF